MTEHKCSFCGVKEDEVKVLVGDESGGAYICEACWEKIGMLLEHSEIVSKAECFTTKRNIRMKQRRLPLKRATF